MDAEPIHHMVIENFVLELIRLRRPKEVTYQILYMPVSPTYAMPRPYPQFTLWTCGSPPRPADVGERKPGLVHG